MTLKYDASGMATPDDFTAIEDDRLIPDDGFSFDLSEGEWEPETDWVAELALMGKSVDDLHSTDDVMDAVAAIQARQDADRPTRH